MIHPHPGTYRGLLAAVKGCFSFPAAGGGVEGTEAAALGITRGRMKSSWLA